MTDDQIKSLFKPTLIDRAVSYVSPTRGLSRIASRAKLKMFRYQGAIPNRLRKTAPATIDPESDTYQRDRYRLLTEARDLVENFPIVTGVNRKFAIYVCGKLRYQAHTGNKALDEAVERYLNEWMQSCDVTGRNNFTKFAQLAVQSEKMDGDLGFIIVSTDEGLKLQAVESDRIGDPNSGMTSDNYFGGINVDDNGAPVSYAIYKRNRRTTSYTFDRDVEAGNFIHYYDPSRFSQYRGVSAYASVINTAKDINELMEGIRIRTKFASYLTALVTTQNGGASPEDWFAGETSQTGQRLAEEETKMGMFRYLAPGEDVREFRNEFPSTAIQSAIAMMIREIGTALCLPHGLVWDMSTLAGPGARFEAAQAERTFEYEQQNLRDRFLNPVIQRVLLHAAMTGAISVPEGVNLFSGRWSFPRKLSIDAGRDAKAEIELVRSGMKTMEEYYGDNGLDWNEEMIQVTRERVELRRLAEESDLPLMDLRMLTPSGQIPTAQEEVAIEGDQVLPVEQPTRFSAADVDLTPPKAARDNARKAIAWREKYGDEVKGGTRVGWTRASQLAKGGPLTRETVGRMAAFNRHRQNSGIKEENKGTPWKDAGYVAWLLWGGDAGVNWAMRKMDEIDRAESE